MSMVSLAQILGLVMLIALVLAIVVIAVRRSVLARSGAIDVCWRRSLTPDGRGWVLGQGRYHENEFLLYRSFSPLPGAARKLHRGTLVLGERRQPVGTEPDLLPRDAVIRRCTDGGTTFELALSEEALTGLRSWLESLPPGTRSAPGLFHRGIRKN
ncbi:MAG TPA: DUF2550 domain-containing protein [Nakamurella sp.]|jgi:hypothetical protein|nr:DUF2550 domain-containing protein [Nakamurella sp.]